MVDRLTSAIVLVVLALSMTFIGGCEGPAAKEPAATQADTAAANAAGSEWTQEQKDAFVKAHERAKKGEDN